MNDRTVREVWRRAQRRCEYCHMPQSVYRTPFQIDHIVAKQHGGTDEPGNLALTCLHCNAHKGPNIAGVDPASGATVRLFHPRRDDWDKHFGWSGAVVLSLTDIGRATIAVLAMNHPDYVAVREALLAEGIAIDD